MEKQKNMQLLIITIMAVALLTMSVGFATFSSSLNIAGNVTVTGSSWDVSFDDATYEESTGSVTVDAANRTINGTSITYAVTLTKPGDFYEFTIDVVNSGTFNANLTGVTMSALNTEQDKYLDYTVTYDGVDYDTTTSGLALVLGKDGGTKTVKVRVEYVQPDDPADLPASTVVVPLTATLNYVQAA